MSTTATRRTRSHARRRWRLVVSWTALLALAWPSLGPLPYVVHDPGGRSAEGATYATHAHRDAARHDADASSIPGSPTHPDDHHCPECEVLKHLSRCVPAVFSVAVVAPFVAAIVTARIALPRPTAVRIARLPPVRAPPLADVPRLSLAR